MRKWIIAFAAVGLLCMTAGVTGAHGGHQSRWWNTPQYMEALKLTDGDIQQLNQAYETSSLDMIKLKGQVEAARLKLQYMMEKFDVSDEETGSILHFDGTNGDFLGVYVEFGSGGLGSPYPQTEEGAGRAGRAPGNPLRLGGQA